MILIVLMEHSVYAHFTFMFWGFIFMAFRVYFINLRNPCFHPMVPLEIPFHYQQRGDKLWHVIGKRSCVKNLRVCSCFCPFPFTQVCVVEGRQNRINCYYLKDIGKEDFSASYMNSQCFVLGVNDWYINVFNIYLYDIYFLTSNSFFRFSCWIFSSITLSSINESRGTYSVLVLLSVLCRV